MRLGRVDLDDLVDLELDAATAADQPAAGNQEPPDAPDKSAGGGVNTETALEALERLLNQVKNRRQQLAADSAA